MILKVRLMKEAYMNTVCGARKKLLTYCGKSLRDSL